MELNITEEWLAAHAHDDDEATIGAGIPNDDEYVKRLGLTLPIIVKRCPFCNHLPDVIGDLRDVLHPVTRDFSVWEFNCLEIEGGCGASILGGSPQECIDKWNRRVSEKH